MSSIKSEIRYDSRGSFLPINKLLPNGCDLPSVFRRVIGAQDGISLSFICQVSEIALRSRFRATNNPCLTDTAQLLTQPNSKSLMPKA